MYATEIGWPTYVGTKGVSEPRAAAYVARLYLLAPMHNYLKGIYWYTRIDSGTDPLVLGQHFGLTNFDHTPKASVCAMRQVAQMLASHKPVSATRDERGVWIAKFTSGTSNVFAVWTQDPLATIHSNVSTSAPSGAPITAAGICADINVAGNGSTLLSADITNSPILFTTMADTILVP